MKRLRMPWLVVGGILLLSGCTARYGYQDLIPRASQIPDTQPCALDGTYTLRGPSGGSTSVRIANGKMVVTAGAMAGYAVAKGITRDRSDPYHVAFSCLNLSWNLSKRIYGWGPARIQMSGRGRFVYNSVANPATGAAAVSKYTLILVRADNRRAMARLQEELVSVPAAMTVTWTPGDTDSKPGGLYKIDGKDISDLVPRRVYLHPGKHIFTYYTYATWRQNSGNVRSTLTVLINEKGAFSGEAGKTYAWGEVLQKINPEAASLAKKSASKPPLLFQMNSQSNP